MELFDYEKQHLQTLRNSLAECTVLLRSNGDFPLAAPDKIAAYGCGVRKTVKGGTGSGEVNSRPLNAVKPSAALHAMNIRTKVSGCRGNLQLGGIGASVCMEGNKVAGGHF